MTEEWRVIPGFDGRYEASDQGRIRSLVGRHGPRKTPHMLTQFPNGNYIKATVTRPDGTYYPAGVHTLIAAAFHGPCPPGLECAHLDGDTTNNVPSNLLWATPLVNGGHKVLHGTAAKGEANGSAVLDEAAAIDIVRLLGEGQVSQVDIAKKHGISVSTVSAIKAGRLWKHLPRQVPA